MAAALEIEDGPPSEWWLSPDIWVVPGEDPLGNPGMPKAGVPAYLWARVHNIGTQRIENAQCNFYWVNPTPSGFDRNTANKVGVSFVSLSPGESAECLCLTPWTPTYMNGGHECVIVEAYHPTLDPLPSAPAFNVPTDRHVAQRNLSVVRTPPSGHFSIPFEVVNHERVARTFDIRSHRGDIARVQELAEKLPELKSVPASTTKASRIGFVQSTCASESDLERAAEVLSVELPPFGRRGYSVIGMLEGVSAVHHVQQMLEGRPTGGFTVVVAGQEG